MNGRPLRRRQLRRRHRSCDGGILQAVRRVRQASPEHRHPVSRLRLRASGQRSAEGRRRPGAGTFPHAKGVAAVLAVVAVLVSASLGPAGEPREAKAEVESSMARTAPLDTARVAAPPAKSGSELRVAVLPTESSRELRVAQSWTEVRKSQTRGPRSRPCSCPGRHGAGGLARAGVVSRGAGGRGTRLRPPLGARGARGGRGTVAH